jgi:hypothetical protein
MKSPTCRCGLVFWELKRRNFQVNFEARLFGNCTSQDQLVYRKLIRRMRGIQWCKNHCRVFKNKRDRVQMETALDQAEIQKFSVVPKMNRFKLNVVQMIELVERIPMKEESLLCCHFEQSYVFLFSVLEFSQNLNEQTTVFRFKGSILKT